MKLWTIHRSLLGTKFRLKFQWEKIPKLDFDVELFGLLVFFLQMTSNIVGYGAQKEQFSLDVNRSYRDISDKVYSRFKLDFTKSKYFLERQDILKAGQFNKIEERSFLNDL